MSDQASAVTPTVAMLYPYKGKRVSDLIPYARNARTHSDEQIAQIAASIREFGFINPIIVDGANGIIAGHGRVLAARKLGLNEVPTLEVSGLTDAQRRAYIMADNKLALNAEWDAEMLKVELKDLDDMEFVLPIIGFSTEEIEKLFDEPQFSPGTEDEQGRLNELSPKMVHCPNCGTEFDLRKNGEG